MRYEHRVLVGFKRDHRWSPKVKARVAGKVSSVHKPKELYCFLDLVFEHIWNYIGVLAGHGVRGAFSLERIIP